MTLKQCLQQALEKNHLVVEAETQNTLLAYLELLAHWNRVHNLTAIRDPKEMIFLHLIDSLMINPFLIGSRIIDVGTGAGLPGIPLALMNPEKQFTLVDSNNKKILFLRQVILELGIKNVEPLHCRIEKLYPEILFDCVVTRAFASIKNMLHVTQHLVKQGGKFLAMKGIYPEDELKELSDNFVILDTHVLKINGLDVERHLVCIEKH